MNKNVTVNSEIPQTGSETAAALSSEWESLTITSRFIFAKIFQQEDICLTLLQRLFPKLDITEVKYVEAEKTVEGSIGSKAVRFDVYVKTPKKYAFTLEMQVENRDSLPKRSRYYSAMMCEDLLALGASYGSLPPAYVVMFCPFDLFRKGRHIYTFTYKCSEDPSVSLEDGSCVMFLNSKGTADDVSPEILSFLNYMEGIVTEGDELIARLEDAVRKAKKNAVWRREYMMYKMEMAHERWVARQEGREEGREEVIIEMTAALVEKGWDLPAIADLLKKEKAEIRPVYDLILSMPDASPGEIFKALHPESEEKA